MARSHQRSPRLLRPLTGQFLAIQIGDDAVARSLGLPRASWLGVAVDRGVKSLHRRLTRFTAPPRGPMFVPGQVAGPYVHGYSLEDIEKP